MKLVLDEHFSFEIAEALQKRGYDVVAAASHGTRPGQGLRGTADESLLRWARAIDRVLITENARHFAPLHTAWLSRGELHPGIVLTSSRTFLRNPDSFGRLITAVATFIDVNESRSMEGILVWL